ncbi:MAG: hypothetical protein AAF589_01110 [Planctomycetota bacterium]
MSTQAPRFVALGASNLRRGFPEFVDVARSLAGGSVQLLAATGHGRSYGRWSSVAGRQLPGIVDCGLWRELAEGNAASTTALVTDIGNDLLYGVEPQQLVAWVAQCVERLVAVGARATVTMLPVGGLEALSPARYRFFRTLFFPQCRLSLNEIGRRAHEVNDGLRDVTSSLDARLLAPHDNWYGFDPIHIHRHELPTAWRFFLTGEPSQDDAQNGRHTGSQYSPAKLWSRAHLQLAPPAERRYFGFKREREQPSRVLRCGTTISLF